MKVIDILIAFGELVRAFLITYTFFTMIEVKAYIKKEKEKKGE